MTESDFFPGDFKCRFCTECLGYGCIGQLPGMGGVNQNKNFILNCSEWDKLPADKAVSVSAADLGIAPVTGAVQNIGFENEADFYFNYFKVALESGVMICVGDGAPDEKLILGHKAVQDLKTSAYYFFKPYPDERLVQRIDMVRDTAVAVGMDIDAYNIVTMRNQVKLECKTKGQIQALREYAKLPFMLKGIFTKKDVELCREVHPDIIVVSNHGGRVDTEEGSTAAFLAKYAGQLKDCAGEIWVDGGIRKKRDIQAAKMLGAKKVLAARPLIASLCQNGVSGMKNRIMDILHN